MFRLCQRQQQRILRKTKNLKIGSSTTTGAIRHNASAGPAIPTQPVASSISEMINQVPPTAAYSLNAIPKPNLNGRNYKNVVNATGESYEGEKNIPIRSEATIFSPPPTSKKNGNAFPTRKNGSGNGLGDAAIGGIYEQIRNNNATEKGRNSTFVESPESTMNQDEKHHTGAAYVSVPHSDDDYTGSSGGPSSSNTNGSSSSSSSTSSSSSSSSSGSGGSERISGILTYTRGAATRLIHSNALEELRHVLFDVWLTPLIVWCFTAALWYWVSAHRRRLERATESSQAGISQRCKNVETIAAGLISKWEVDVAARDDELRKIQERSGELARTTDKLSALLRQINVQPSSQ